MKTIMTIDDSSSMRTMIAFTLTTAGFEAVQAARRERGAGFTQKPRNSLVPVASETCRT
jgi:hypothetical protein